MSNRAEYILSTFSSIYHWLDYDLIDYGVSTGSPIRIHNTSDFYNEKRLLDPSEFRFYEIRGESIPVPFHSNRDELIVKKNGQVEITFDLISASFYWLSGWQEYYSEIKDQHGRYPFKESLQYKLGCVEVPIVNYYFHVLAEIISEVSGDVLVPKSKNGEQMSLSLSHDIDLCTTGWKEELGFALKKLQIGTAISVLCSQIKGKDPWWTFKQILAIEKKHNVTSTFFFLPSRETIKCIRQADYDMDDVKIKAVFQEIRDHSSEVQLHGSVGSHHDSAILSKNLAKFDSSVKKNRFHFLLWDARVTPGVLDDAGIEQDSTLGFAEHIGFRNAICHPFKLYNLSKDKVTQVEEIPLMIMDTTLYNKGYMNIPVDEVQFRIQKLVHEVDKYNGVLSLLWHNNYFFEGKYGGWGEVYGRILK